MTLKIFHKNFKNFGFLWILVANPMDAAHTGISYNFAFNPR